MLVKKASVKKSRPSVHAEGQIHKHVRSYKELLELCGKLDPEKNEVLLENDKKNFAIVSNHISREIEDFKSKIHSIPFIAIMLVWASHVEKDRVFGSRYLEMMQELITTNMIPHKNQKNKLLTMKDFSSFEHSKTIDVIRCEMNWSEQKKEDYVSFYLSFLDWLSDATFGYIAKVQDPDRQLTIRRRLPYETYVKFLANLSTREKLLAKIFYLGGNRSLDEVLSLQIQDIDYTKSHLSFSNSFTPYPKHVLEDLRVYIGERKNGFVFVGRDNNKLDPTVPYRALKTVVSKLGLDSSFTFKDFAKDF